MIKTLLLNIFWTCLWSRLLVKHRPRYSVMKTITTLFRVNRCVCLCDYYATDAVLISEHWQCHTWTYEWNVQLHRKKEETKNTHDSECSVQDSNFNSNLFGRGQSIYDEDECPETFHDKFFVEPFFRTWYSELFELFSAFN